MMRICIENASCKSHFRYFFCSGEFRFHHFAKMYSPLEHWRLQIITHWAIFLARMALKLFCRRFSASVAHPNFEKSSAKRVVSAQVAVLQNDIIYHTCNFVTFWWLVPFAVCFWWLYIHFFAKMLSRFTFFHIFTKACSPLEQEAHFWKQTLSNPPSKIHFLQPWKS